MLAVRVGFDYGTVVLLLNVVALPTTNPLQLLRVPYRLVRIDSKVDFPVAAVYLGMVEIELELPRLIWDLGWGCNLGMRILDSSLGAFAITSLHALFACLRVELLILLYVHLPLLFSSIGQYVSPCFMPALLVRSLFAVWIVAHPAQSSPCLKIVAPLTTYLKQLRDVRFWHCHWVTEDQRS